MHAPTCQESSHVSTPQTTASTPRSPPHPVGAPPARPSLSVVARKNSPRVSSRHRRSAKGAAMDGERTRTRVDARRIAVPIKSRMENRTKKRTSPAFPYSQVGGSQRLSPFGLSVPLASVAAPGTACPSAASLCPAEEKGRERRLTFNRPTRPTRATPAINPVA